MNFEHRKRSLAGVWALAVCSAGLVAQATSAWGWVAIAGMAVVPPILLLSLWHRPVQTMSESINEARR